MSTTNRIRPTPQNVRASPLEMSMNSTLKYVPPRFPKSSEDEMFLYEALKRNFVFENVPELDLFETAFSLVEAMEQIQYHENEVIIRQGDLGDYFYVLQEGNCRVQIDEQIVGFIPPGGTFGELALMYQSPRAATVTAVEPARLFRVDQKTFRLMCQKQVQLAELQKRQRLDSVPFLAELCDPDKIKLTDAMAVRVFQKGESLQQKGQQVNLFWMIEQGELQLKDIEMGGKRVANITLESGEYFGQHALITGIPALCNAVALTDGCAFVLHKDQVKEVIGDLDKARERGIHKKILESIRVIKNTMLSGTTLDALVKMAKEVTYKQGEIIMKEGEPVLAALYFLRKGAVHLLSPREDNLMEEVGIFGEDMITLDARRGKKGPEDSTVVMAPYTCKVTKDATLVVLKLADCRKVFDTCQIGKGGNMFDSVVTKERLHASDFAKHTILGSGTFGQVWLVSRTASDGMERVYALKVQAKSELVRRAQAKSVILEKKIMAALDHPFITKLVASFQDTCFVYMLMDFVQGGELETIIYNQKGLRLTEDAVMFYAAGILEALSYMHRLGYVYRDLKPQNVLINKQGYPVLTDLGFAKFVKVKTFTFCGSPLYIAPEIILNRGHGWAADHWSFGVLVFEMLTGTFPFGEDFADQIDLFATVVQSRLELPSYFSRESSWLIRGLLEKNPRKRLGSLANGVDDLYEHPWFRGIDFERLLRQEIDAPFVPDIEDYMDTSNFEEQTTEKDKTKMEYDRLDPSDEKIFERF